MTELYNACLKSGHFPEKYKIAKVLTMAKLGTEEDSDPSIYIPFSLLNTEGKILEKNFNQNNYAPPIQNIFTKWEPIWIHTTKEHGRRCHGS